MADASLINNDSSLDSPSNKGKYFIGFLILAVLTASVWIAIPGSVKIDIKNTYSNFYTWEDNSWTLAGTERVKIFDGVALMRASSRKVETFNNPSDNSTTIVRTSNFKEGIILIDTYFFDGNSDDVTLFPVDHNVVVLGAKRDRPYKLVYEVSKLEYFGLTESNIESPRSFGHNMKVEWDEGNYYSKIYKYKDKNEGKLTIKYDITSDKFIKNMRLFDPPVEGNDLIITNGQTITLGGINDTYDNIWVQTGGTLKVDITDGYLTLIANNITIDGTLDGINMYAGGTGGSCSSTTTGHSGAGGTGLTPGGGGSGTESDFFSHGLGGGGAGNARPHIEYYSSGCDGYDYYIGEGGGYCGAFDIWKSGGSAGNAALSTEVDFNFTAGSGGGGGGCLGYANGGAGGAGAGIIVLNAPIVNVHGNVNLYGSNGNNGVLTGGDGAAGGGGAGSGGSFGIFGNIVDISNANINVNSASGGSASGNSWRYTNGGTSSGGRIKVFYNTLDNESLVTTLGDFGTYYVDQISNPKAILISSNDNLTTENISAYCNNTLALDNITYYWSIYKNNILNVSGISENVDGLTNVYNFSENVFKHNDTLKLICSLDYNYTNISQSIEVQMHSPIHLNITSPLNNSILQGAYQSIDYDFENYTKFDNCWYTENGGATNITVECIGHITKNWPEGLNNVIIYTNTSSDSTAPGLEFNDSVTFSTIVGPPVVSYKSPTPDNGSYIDYNNLVVAVDITPCEGFKNITYNLVGVDIA